MHVVPCMLRVCPDHVDPISGGWVVSFCGVTLVCPQTGNFFFVWLCFLIRRQPPIRSSKHKTPAPSQYRYGGFLFLPYRCCEFEEDPHTQISGPRKKQNVFQDSRVLARYSGQKGVSISGKAHCKDPVDRKSLEGQMGYRSFLHLPKRVERLNRLWLF